ncbi:MAG: exodeoxyribonuclease VII small subunit, partial [Halobacteriovoraceae bacterium]|nr:exodeoxyribonuclease VII small subunit [Halobacteriovoraceae bacterium]
MSKAKKKTFEQSLQSLEKIVDDLESGKLPLEESLYKFEEGVKLYKECKDMLGKVEKKITIL